MDKISATRFSGLGYTMQAKCLWRFVDLDTKQVIGAQYPTKAELLADIATFASDRGFSIA